MPGFSLHKSEKVRSQKLIESLFGKKTPAFVHAGFRIAWVQTDTTQAPCSVLFVSPKKKLKLAHDRNKRKRLLRELYRLNKQDLLDYLQASNLHIAISLNYVGIEPLSFHLHQVGFQKALNKLILELQKNHSVSLPPAH